MYLLFIFHTNMCSQYNLFYIKLQMTHTVTRAHHHSFEIKISICMHIIESRETSNRKYLSKTMMAFRERQANKMHTTHK